MEAGEKVNLIEDDYQEVLKMAADSILMYTPKRNGLTFRLGVAPNTIRKGRRNK